MKLFERRVLGIPTLWGRAWSLSAISKFSKWDILRGDSRRKVQEIKVGLSIVFYMEASWWNWYRLFSCFYRPGKIPVSIARTRRETIASSFFNPDAGRNSPRGSTDLPQRNVLPPRCLTLRLFFFLEPLYPFQRCSIRSLSSPLASFCRFYPSFFLSLSQVVHSFLGLSPLVHTTFSLAVLSSSWPSRFYRRRQQIFLILLFNLTEDAIFFLISTLTISRKRRRVKSE